MYVCVNMCACTRMKYVCVCAHVGQRSAEDVFLSSSHFILHLYVGMIVGTHVPRPGWEGQETTWGVGCHLLPCLRQGTLMLSVVYMRPADL